jgi:hypothetical protein
MIHFAIVMTYLSVALAVAAAIGIGILFVEVSFWIFCQIFGMIDNQIQKLPMKVVEHKNNNNRDFYAKKVA